VKGLMLPSLILQRVLPFILTLAVGALAASAGKFLRWTGGAERAATGVLVFKERGRAGCRDRSARVPSAGEKLRPVVYTYEPNTRYTAEAMRRGVTGVVRLRVTFGAAGRIEAVDPVLGLPHGLTKEAERVAWQTRFEPATDEHGRPVTVTQDVNYVFSLNDRMKAGL
ncbi:MAG TPA: energy transducer TonB, partial [Pyrinomonadaceae bacterium]|nr:energy transducer TonB [Pyrinomonadaceae bacterium]